MKMETSIFCRKCNALFIAPKHTKECKFCWSEDLTEHFGLIKDLNEKKIHFSHEKKLLKFKEQNYKHSPLEGNYSFGFGFEEDQLEESLQKYKMQGYQIVSLS